MSHSEHADVKKPPPPISDFNKPFWEAAKRHSLELQQCNDCKQPWAPSGPVCPKCFSDCFSWVKMSGRGKIASWVVFHKEYHPAFAKELPYNVAFVELDEGPRLITNIVGAANKDLRIGMPVEVTFEDVDAQFSLPKFRPMRR